MRLRHDAEYQRVYGARVKKIKGPLIGYAAPNQRMHWRLGLSVGKAVGNAVRRHALKRALRDAFRLEQHGLPRLDDGGLDVIIGARAHDPVDAAEYRRFVTDLAAALHREWERRRSQ